MEANENPSAIKPRQVIDPQGISGPGNVFRRLFWLSFDNPDILSITVACSKIGPFIPGSDVSRFNPLSPNMFRGIVQILTDTSH